MSAAAASPSAEEVAFPPLRDEMIVERGPHLRDGSPSWTLYDPAANRFFRIGWLEFEILCRWHLRGVQQIRDRIWNETTLRPDAQDIEGFAKFLSRANLLSDAGPEGTQRLLAQRAARRQDWATWLLHHYLFIRIPLFHPDAMLRAMVSRTGWLYTRAFFLVTVFAGVVGLFLALRQWDSFSSSLLWFFSLEGIAISALALLFSKILHELGHGLTARRYGCRVPTTGVALLVLAPVLYTDTTEAWRLKERHKRLAIGSAGVIAECYLAAYALLAWSFLPDGLLRSVVFIWASTTWVLTVLINMSPFMRFDGYYLLSDFLDVPNLQERGFALTRHRIRRLLLGLDEPPPEEWSPGMARILTAYSIATWIYRFVLFLGIAVIVYHMFFKALGIILFAVEIWWFILRPIAMEINQWIQRRKDMTLNRNLIISASALVFLIGLLIFPWQTKIRLPAIMGAETRMDVFAQTPGQIVTIDVRRGDMVSEGQPIMRLSSPELDFKLTQAETQVRTLTAQTANAAQDAESIGRLQIVHRELIGAKAEMQALTVEKGRLTIAAPTSGVVIDLPDTFKAGEWLKAGEQVATIADLDATRIEAYVSEADLRRIGAGASARFIPSDVSSPRIDAQVTSIDSTSARLLADRELGSVYNGAIAVRADAKGNLTPEVPVYRVLLQPLDGPRRERVSIGIVIVDGKAESLVGQAWRRVVGVLIREAGF